MQFKKLLAWDVGGAHLKCAEFDASGRLLAIKQFPTPLWKGDESLQLIIKKYALEKNQAMHVVTMTAELSDIYLTRVHGVLALSQLFIDALSVDTVLFYGGPDGFIHFSDVEDYVQLIASMNWHATASYLAAETEQSLLIDMGSSTTDVIPFDSGKLLNRGYTDHERLVHHELVYTGVIRTAVMSICDELQIHGQACPVMNELFATTADVYRILGVLDKQYDMQDTADGQEKTNQASARRLARMLGLDYPININFNDCIDIADQIRTKQLQSISQAVETQLKRNGKITFKNIIGAGCGRFLLEEVAEQFSLNYLDYYHFITTPEHNETAAAHYATAVSVGKLFLKNHAKIN